MDIRIDCSSIRDKEALHSTLSAALSFPDWYGKNLDALYDCLSAVTASVHLLHWDQAEAALGNYGKNARRVLTEATERNLPLEILFE